MQEDIYEYQDVLYHHGVKGMKWGRRKDRNRKSDREYAKQHDRAIYNRYKEAKSNYKTTVKKAKADYKANVKKTGNKKQAKTIYEDSVKNSKKEYKDAYIARSKNVSNNTGLLLGLGIGQTARGTYYRNREAGRSKVNSAIKAWGKQTAINLVFGGAMTGTLAAGKYFLKKALR